MVGLYGTAGTKGRAPAHLVLMDARLWRESHGEISVFGARAPNTEIVYIKAKRHFSVEEVSVVTNGYGKKNGSVCGSPTRTQKTLKPLFFGTSPPSALGPQPGPRAGKKKSKIFRFFFIEKKILS
jgi:hypothetical protein